MKSIVRDMDSFAARFASRLALPALLLTAAAVFAGASRPAHAANPPLTVSLASCGGASVTGFVGDYPEFGGYPGQMRQFLGVPYALPPVGARRWTPPQKKCWSGNLSTTAFGNPCPQNSNTNEDCLYLNVFTQPTGAVSNQPVMVFIHGGALTSGAGSWFANPVALVAKGIVVVTINYRLGALGFLAHPALDKVASKYTGNYGIQDQQFALTWIKQNISKFGGNPNNVTIFGQSAGGLSVLVHLVSPPSKGLYQKAIIESGGFYKAATMLSDAESQGMSFASQAGCSSQSAACLRGLSVATILANQSALGSSTRLLKQDGVVLTDSIENLLKTGQFNKVPTINGTTHDEVRFHIAGNTTLGTGDPCHFTSNLVPNNMANFAGAVRYQDALLNNFVPSNLDPMVEGQYPAGTSGTSANIAFAKQATDHFFVCRPFRVAKWIAQNGGTLYAYEFNDPHAPPYLWSPFKLHDGTTFAYGAYHGAELPYLFRMKQTNACGAAIPAFTVSQKMLSNAIVTYWTTFAKTGNPNPTSGQPNWPMFTVTGGSLLSFVAATPKLLTATAFDTDHKCTSFWDQNSP